MNNNTIKNISERSIVNRQDNQQNQIELVFETDSKTEKIQFSGNGALKVSAPILM